MKKFLILSAALLSQIQFLTASVQVEPRHFSKPDMNVEDHFVTSSETDRQDWGCPVSEFVPAGTPTEAIDRIKHECSLQVSQEAARKPGVLDVIRTEVVWPDVQVTEAKGGYYLNGTFFLQTVVMLRGNGH